MSDGFDDIEKVLFASVGAKMRNINSSITSESTTLNNKGTDKLIGTLLSSEGDRGRNNPPVHQARSNVGNLGDSTVVPQTGLTEEVLKSVMEYDAQEKAQVQAATGNTPVAAVAAANQPITRGVQNELDLMTENKDQLTFIFDKFPSIKAACEGVTKIEGDVEKMNKKLDKILDLLDTIIRRTD